MTFLTIRNIGPVVDTGRIAITNLTLFIGRQSTGKSTLMKILCYCSWIEKHLMSGDDKFLYDFTHYQRFLRELKKFHRLSDEEFTPSSYIEYESDNVKIEQIGNKRNVKIAKKTGFAQNSHNFKQSYLPAERNLLSSVQNIERSYRSNYIDNVFNFIVEWRIAKDMFTAEKPLNVVVTKGMKYFYDADSDKDVLQISQGKNITPFYASSGVQSALPILAMSQYLASAVGTKSFSVSDVVANKNLNALSYQYFKVFIEEPEQNLFPTSQFDLLKELVKLVGHRTGSYLVMTSHSPYILSAINIMIRASQAMEKDPERTRKLIDYVVLAQESFSAYYISESGEVHTLIDEETGLIRGEYLDSVSDTFDDITFRLNFLIYGDD